MENFWRRSNRNEKVSPWLAWEGGVSRGSDDGRKGSPNAACGFNNIVFTVAEHTLLQISQSVPIFTSERRYSSKMLLFK